MDWILTSGRFAVLRGRSGGLDSVRAKTLWKFLCGSVGWGEGLSLCGP